MQLRGTRLLLRTPIPEDVSYIHNWENDPSLSFVNVNSTYLSEEEITNWIISRQHDLFLEGELRLIICDEKNHVAGSIDLFDYNPATLSAGVGIVIEEKRRREGIGKEALTVLSDHCFSKLRIETLWCNIPASNFSSIKLFSGCGFIEQNNSKNQIAGCLHLRRSK